MRTIILLLLISATAFSQETEYKFTKDGFTDFIVTAVENKTQAELYRKALDWISVTYKNPKEVIKAQIENDYIRIEGANDALICYSGLGSENCPLAKYQIEISFKDGKYKFDLIEITQYTSGWNTIALDAETIKLYYNKKGEIRNNYKLFEKKIPEYFNNLNSSLKEFLTNDKTVGKKSDW